jgi:putative tricarboxylic transport membrane protein
MKRPRIATVAIAAMAALAMATTGCAKIGGTQAGQAADNYPAKGKSVTLLLPFAAGGTTDVLARLLAPELEKSLGTSVQVVNKPGSGGQLGLTELAGSKPDGYTIGFTNVPSALSTYLNPQRKATYTKASFKPIAGLTWSANYLVVHKDSPYKTWQDLATAAKANPGKLSAVISGGSLGDDHLIMLDLEKKAGMKFNLVPVDSGTDKTTALLGKKVDVTVGGGTTVLPQVKTGDFRGLAVLVDTNDKFMPGVPTLASLGIPMNAGGTLAISAPAGAPDAVVTKIEAAIRTAMEAPAFVEKVRANFQEPTFKSSTELDKLWTDAENTIKPLIAENLPK